MVSGSVVRRIESLFEGGSVTGLSDRQLLERFNGRRDAAGETAFAALVTRHGPMVLHVCRQLLGDVHHAEDAFQAVFLVLARKAGSIQNPDLLGNWLYGVALRTAKKAKVQLAHRRKNEEGGSMRRPGSGAGASIMVESTVPPAEQPVLAREEVEALHDEIARLPRSFRLPVVLCYFEGLTLDEVARRLRWPAGTVRSRLARARDKLRRGLTRRGVALPAAVLATALGTKSASAHISSLLCDTTTKAAIHFAAGQAAREVVSTSAAALAQEVLRAMFFTKLKLTVLTLIVLGSVATGVGYLTHSLAMKDEPKPVQAGRQQPAAKTDEPNRAAPAPGRMTLIGRVLDPAGKPMAGVPVEVIGRPSGPAVAGQETWSPSILLGRGDTGADGRFRLDAARTSSAGFLQVHALAAAAGFGLGWAEPNPDAEQPAAEIRLRPEQIIRGKLVDVSGRPAAGVEIRVRSLAHHDAGRLDDWIGASPPEEMLTWPHRIMTDDQGRFTLAGIGRATTVYLGVRDSRFPTQTIPVQTDDRAGPKDLTCALQPSTIVEGRVLAADTGQPIPRAIVSVGSSIHWLFSGAGRHFPADDQGRFTAQVAPGQYYSVRAYPPEGQPYVIPEHRFEWTKGAVKTMMDITLPRGVLIRGKVIEEGTGRPLAGASVQFSANPRRDDVISDTQAIVASKDDGSFQIAVPPGKGHLLVFGPTKDYILEEIGAQELWRGRPGGWRTYAHDIIAYEVKLGDPLRELVAVLRPGKTVRGRVVAPDGQPVEAAAILTPLDIADTRTSWRGAHTLHARDGHFELHGLDPEKSVPVIFFDADHQRGATVELSGKQAGEDVTVRLQSNGRATARFVGPDGKPVAGFALGFDFQILITPGPPNLTRKREDQVKRLADAGDMVNIDPRHYLNFPPADREGRVTLPNLIPGALYRICDRSTEDVPDKGVQARKDFTVKPGETLDLGEILIEKPQS